MNKIVLTNAGIAELINAEQTGTAPVELVQVGLGTGKYDASATQTALSAEFKRLSTISGGAAGDNVIHLFVTDTSSDAYSAYEVGIYTESGTLLGAVSSRTEPIVQKASGSTALLAIDFVLTNADPDSITVGDTNFVLPPATTEMQGIVELATAAETQAGTDTYRAVTPYALAQRTATAIRKGLMRFATVAESETGTNTDSAVTPAGLMAVAAKYLPLAGGAMAGQIKSNIGDILARNVDGGWLRINGSTTDANGANLTLWGKSATEAGQFRLMARNTASYSLVGTSAGVLTWSGPVVTASDDSTKIATTAYVKDCLPKSVGSATKLTYTDSNGVLTASTSTVGSASKPVYLNGGTLTECSSSLTDYLPLAGGYMDNGAIIYLTENTFSLDNTYTSAKEATGLVFRLKQTKDDNTTATYKGYILVLHVNTLSNTHNYEAGWRIGNPRSGNNPSAGTDDGVDIGTGNCWDKLGLRYFFDINKAYAYTSRNPPLRGASTKYYKTDHLVTHGNLEHFLTRDGNENYPLGATIPSTVGDIVKRTADTSWARINGGTSFSDGANLLLYGINSSSNAGLFQLQARASASTSWQLKGDNTGLLSWNGSILNTGGVIVNQKNHFRIKDTDYAYNEVPSSDSHLSFGRVDKNNANVGRFQISRYATTGNQQVHLVVNSPVDGSEKVFLRGIQDSSGNHWVEISETRTTGTSNKEPVTVGYLNSRLGSYLPLAGGTMTGTIKTGQGTFATATNNSSYLALYGGSSTSGTSPALVIYGSQHSSNAGKVVLRSGDGTNTASINLLAKSSNSSGLQFGSDTYVLSRQNDSGYLKILGGTDNNKGGRISIYGKDASEANMRGAVRIATHDGTTERKLNLYASGNIDTSSFTLNKTGTTYIGSVLNMVNTDNGRSNTTIRVYGDGSDAGTSNYGNDVCFGANGATYICGGESVTALRTALISNGQTTINGSDETIDPHAEHLFLAADQSVYVFTGCNNIGNRKVIKFSQNGNVIATTGFYFGDNSAIYQDSNADIVISPNNSGALFRLRNAENGGRWQLRASDGTHTHYLIGQSDGSLTWSGTDVARGNAGDSDTPVYVSNGVVTSTGKSFSSYLPLAGGTMTGTIKVPRIAMNLYSDTDELVIYGSSNNNTKGPCVALRGISRGNDPGSFYIRSGDGDSNYVLLGKIDGTLTWNGNVPATSDDSTKIATTAYVKDCVPKSKGGGTKLLYTNSTGVVAESSSTVGSKTKPVFLNSGTITVSDANVGSTSQPLHMAGGELKACTMAAYNTAGFLRQTEQSLNTDGSGYVVLNSGLKIQWGTMTQPQLGDVTFPKPFTKVPVVTLGHAGGDYAVKLYNLTTTGFHTANRETVDYYYWVAIGR